MAHVGTSNPLLPERRPPPDFRRPRPPRRLPSLSGSESSPLLQWEGFDDGRSSASRARRRPSDGALVRTASEPIMRRGPRAAPQLDGATYEHFMGAESGEWYQDNRQLHCSAFFWDPFVAVSEWIGVEDTMMVRLPSSRALHGVPVASLAIIAVDFGVRLVHAGVSTVLLLFLEEPLRVPPPLAASSVLIFMAISTAAPLWSGYLADSYHGKLPVLLAFLLLLTFGIVLLSAGAALWSASPALSLFLSSVGLLAVALGAGGVRSGIAALGAAQIDSDSHTAERITRQYLHWLSLSAMAAVALGCMGVCLIVPTFGYAPCFIVLTLSILTCTIGLFTIRSHCLSLPPSGFVLGVFWSVMFVAIKWRWHYGPSRNSFLSSAIPVHGRHIVDETKPVVAILKVYGILAPAWALVAHASIQWTEQARTMTHPAGLSPAIVQVFYAVAIPVVLYSLRCAARRSLLPLPLLPRISLGIFLLALAYAIAALLQLLLLSFPSLPIWAQAPQWAIFSMGVGLFSIATLEFICNEIPDAMRIAAIELQLAGAAGATLLLALLWPAVSLAVPAAHLQSSGCAVWLALSGGAVLRFGKGYPYATAGPDLDCVLEYDDGERESIF